MQTLGVIGGMSWQSTATYYKQLNEGIRDALGGLHSAPLLVYSVDFAEIAALQKAGEWDVAAAQLADVAKRLERAGAGALLLATNTMHKVAPSIEAAVNIPLLHIGDAVGHALQASGVKRAALLGTRFTMQEDFYRQRLEQRFGIEVLIPGVEAMVEIDRAIFAELCLGDFRPATRDFYLDALQQMRDQGAEAAILGCTEIGLLLADTESPLPLIDSAERHVAMGLEWLLRQS
jgi:aspartate racemase